MMVLPYAWHYLPTGKKQHVIYAQELESFPCQAAMCGCQILSVLPAVARWQNDPEGLEARDKCRLCVGILEKELGLK